MGLTHYSAFFKKGAGFYTFVANRIAFLETVMPTLQHEKIKFDSPVAL